MEKWEPPSDTASPSMAKALPLHSTCDVAIVGNGPVGIVLANLLASYGMSVIMVERHFSRYPTSRAGHVDGEIFRVFQRLGIAHDAELISRAALSYEMLTPDLESLMKIVVSETGSSWKSDYLLYLPQLETILHERAMKLGVQLYMGMTACSLEQDNNKAVLTVRATKALDSDSDVQRASKELGEERHVIEARYVIGADGAGSFVRDQMGVGKHDMGFPPIDNLVLDFEHNDPDRDYPLLQENYQILDIKRPQLAGRWGGSHWSRFEFARNPGETRDYLESDEVCWKTLGRWGVKPEHGRIGRRAVYTFAGSLTEKWRVGRLLLVGDSAHTMPPFMGQGMCSGLRDAVNLSWKLKAVLDGDADEKFLDTYELERSPHVAQLTKMSMKLGSTIMITDPMEGKKRDDLLRSGKMPRPPPFPRLTTGLVRNPDSPDATDVDGRPGPQARVVHGRDIKRLDDFQKPGWKLISRHPISDTLFNPEQKALLSALQVQFAHVSRGASTDTGYLDLDGEYDMWYRNNGRKAFLQRPDNYIFGCVKVLEELPKLVDELSEQLKARGWHGVGPLLNGAVGHNRVNGAVGEK